MFDLNNKKLISECKVQLSEFYKTYKKRYIDMFFYEKDIVLNFIDTYALETVGIIKRVGDLFRANVQVFPLLGKFIVTDFNYSRYRKSGDVYLTQQDGVWGILPEETPVIAKLASLTQHDIVLDLATGSGMIGIFCADKAKKVYATDINPKAINYAHLNAILNGVEDKMGFIVCDMFVGLKNVKFDFIVWNGPTVATPKTPKKYPLYSYGGMDGISFTKKFINNALKYLNPDGKVLWYDCAVGSEKNPASMSYLCKKWSDKNVRVRCNLLTSSPVSLKKTFEIYSKYNLEQPGFKTPLSSRPVTIREENNWHVWLKKNGYTHFFYAIVDVSPDKSFSYEINYPKKDIRTDRYLTRYWLWMSYPTLIKKLKICDSSEVILKSLDGSERG